jgi:hypothetical protein
MLVVLLSLISRMNQMKNVRETLNLLFVLAIALVSLFFLLIPLLTNRNLLAWTQGSDFINFIFYLALIVAGVILVNGIEPEKKPMPKQLKTEVCYCCNNDFTIGEGKHFFICDSCIKEQKMDV